MKLEVYGSNGFEVASDFELSRAPAVEVLTAGFSRSVFKEVDPATHILTLKQCTEVAKSMSKKHVADLSKCKCKKSPLLISWTPEQLTRRKQKPT